MEAGGEEGSGDEGGDIRGEREVTVLEDQMIGVQREREDGVVRQGCEVSREEYGGDMWGDGIFRS